jgi:hypothetical protein
MDASQAQLGVGAACGPCARSMQARSDQGAGRMPGPARCPLAQAALTGGAPCRANGRVERLVDETGQPMGPHRVWLQYAWIPGLAMSRALGDVLAHQVGS